MDTKLTLEQPQETINRSNGAPLIPFSFQSSLGSMIGKGLRSVPSFRSGTDMLTASLRRTTIVWLTPAGRRRSRPQFLRGGWIRLFGRFPKHRR